MSLKTHFARVLAGLGTRQHFCAHSHHPWPDVSLDAQNQAWLDAATLLDGKWDKVFGEIIPAAQSHLARLLNLPDPATLCFGPNTHELLMRLLSCIDARPFRVLTTDSEFHSFSRQMRRIEETGRAQVTRVPVEPFPSFPQRFMQAMAADSHHLVFFSQVFYNSGYCIEDLNAIVDAVPQARTLVVIDGYHGFMAVPTDIGRLAARAFYLAGGYKYAMSGEGVAFIHCPPGYALQPLDTGWFAGFDDLSQRDGGATHFPPDGRRFLGATFDPTGLYRFNAVMSWARNHQISPSTVRTHVSELQRGFLASLDDLNHPILARRHLIPPEPLSRGSFLTFRHPDAASLQQQLQRAQIETDVRHGALRIGLGIYHDRSDIAELLRRLAQLPNKH
ncbi:MAG TPA: aminotransferase class V-fold PLP-dependent enzyme [Fontimonas sp.]